MSKSQETGLMKNVANFRQLISFCTAYGTKYTPVKDDLVLINLNTKHNEAESVIESAKRAKVALDDAINERQILFEPLRKLTTRIISALKVSGASQEKIEDALAMNRKIQGRRATALKTNGNGTPEAEAVEARSISVSQQSYDMLISHFQHLIQILETEVNYNPIENDLKIASLSQYRSDLQLVCARVVGAYTASLNARSHRDQILYDKTTGLHQVAQGVKQYVRSAFGSQSPQYKQVGSLRFSSKKV